MDRIPNFLSSGAPYGLLSVGRNEMVQKLNRERQVSLDEPFLASHFLVLSYLESYFKGVKGRWGRGEWKRNIALPPRLLQKWRFLPSQPLFIFSLF